MAALIIALLLVFAGALLGTSLPDLRMTVGAVQSPGEPLQCEHSLCKWPRQRSLIQELLSFPDWGNWEMFVMGFNRWKH